MGGHNAPNVTMFDDDDESEYEFSDRADSDYEDTLQHSKSLTKTSVCITNGPPETNTRGSKKSTMTSGNKSGSRSSEVNTNFAKLVASHNVDTLQFHNDTGGDDLFAATFGADDDFETYEPMTLAHRPAKKPTTRISNGHVAASRPISADLNEADKELIRLKEAGEPLVKIAKALKDHHGLKYDPKSTHSRYLRLKDALAAQKDQELTLGLDTWHEGEVGDNTRPKMTHSLTLNRMKHL